MSVPLVTGPIGKLRILVCFWWGGEVPFSVWDVGALFPVLLLRLCSCAEIYCHDAHLCSRDPAGHHKHEKWFSRLLAADRRTFIRLCQHAYCVCDCVHACLCSFKHRLCALLVVCYSGKFIWWYFDWDPHWQHIIDSLNVLLSNSSINKRFLTKFGPKFKSFFSCQLNWLPKNFHRSILCLYHPAYMCSKSEKCLVHRFWNAAQPIRLGTLFH